MNKFIYVSVFTRDDGKTFIPHEAGGYFLTRAAAEKTVAKWNKEVTGELSRYEVRELGRSWDEAD